MGRLLLALALLVLAAVAFFEIGRLLFEFAQHDPDYAAWEPLVGILAWVTAAGILINVNRAPQSTHRVALAFFVPMGVVLASVLAISGLGVILLAFADYKEKLIGVAEPYAVVAALLISVAILGGATVLARRGPSTQEPES